MQTFYSFIALFGFSLLLGSFHTNSSKADDILGEWYTTDKDATVIIEKRGTSYQGHLAWLSEATNKDGSAKRDLQNPDKSKRQRIITDFPFLTNFKFDGQSTWRSGSIYNIEDGRTYSGQITLKGENQLILRGYIGSPFLGRSVTWTRKE